eukprot:619334_1
MTTYTWKITDPSLVQQMKNAKNESKWTSPTFSAGGFKWYLDVYPNGIDKSWKGYVDHFLFLAFLPPKVKSIRVRYELRLMETDSVDKHSGHSKSFDKSNMNWGWSRKLLHNQIQNLRTLTFSAKVDVLGVIDHEDNDITSLYVCMDSEESKHSALEHAKQSELKLMVAQLDSLANSVNQLVNNIRSLQQRVTDVERRTNDDEKDDPDNMWAEIKVIKQDLRKLSPIAKMNPKQLKLKSWLENQVGFPQYYEMFMNNGIEDLSIASMLTMETIKNMGIDKVGHQMKLLRAVSKLNDNNINGQWRSDGEGCQADMTAM